MKLSELLKDVELADECPDIEVHKIAYDSRKVEKGDVFVCIKGYASDGHSFAKMAEEKGASVIVAEDSVDVNIPVVYAKDTRLALALMSRAWFKNPLSEMKLIGVTGTNGKTTVTYLIKKILEDRGYKVGLIGTNQNMIGSEIIHTERTTPESYELYELFSDMVSAGCDYAVMEVSSHALELNRVGGCEYETAVFTNLTQDHLDFHGTMENYFNAKKKLFSMCKNAVVNTDCPYGARIAEEFSCLTYGIDNDADLKAEDVSVTAKGVTYSVTYKSEKSQCHIKIPGKFSVYNSLAALGCALTLGVKKADAVRSLADANGVKGRAEIVDTNTDYTVIIDYAHTPDGLENIISTVNEFKKARVITVFGCGGDRDRTKRPKMGKMAASLSDFVVVTSDNPRTENPSSIIDDIMPGVLETNTPYIRIEKREKAIEYALEHAKKDDIIILAGKGHETYQILNEGTIHFDEREIVKQILSGKE